MSWWGHFPRRPSVAEQRAKAARALQRLTRAGQKLSPVTIQGRTIARSFWGRAWCENLESYHDYENRLPRGRSYLVNGAVLDLSIEPGRIRALVSGTSLYEVQVTISPVGPRCWKQIRTRCGGQIGSLIELLQGRLSDQVMHIITHRDQGLFPKPREIEMQCSCPDWAVMCKHVAAVMYGVGARLDREPELLFALRKADHLQLIEQATESGLAVRSGTRRKTIAASAVEEVFGIQLEGAEAAAGKPAKRGARGKPGARAKTEVETRAKSRARGKSTAVKRGGAGRRGGEADVTRTYPRRKRRARA